MDINGIEKINGIIEYYHKHFLIIEIIKDENIKIGEVI